MPQKRGTLLLKGYPPERETEIAAFLARYVRNNGNDLEGIKRVLRKVPLILGRDIPEEEARLFMERLSSLGAEAAFIPSNNNHQPADTHREATEDIQEAGKDSREAKEGPREAQEAPGDIGEASGDTGEDPGDAREAGEEPVFDEALGVFEEASAAGKGESSGHHIDEDRLLKNIFAEENKRTKHSAPFCQRFKKRLRYELYRVNKEFWLVLSMVSIMALMNYLVDSQRLLLSLYILPTVLSAYYFGRRHAVFTALASITMVLFILYYLPQLLHTDPILRLDPEGWRELVAWGGILIVTAYAMGTLYEKYKEKLRELQKTYHGVLLILRHFISKDEYTENHCYRVSIYAVKIAQYLGLPEERIEDLRAAALLHDIGKLKISREILYKAAKLTQEEFEEVKKHVTSSAELLEPMQDALGRIIPIILAHHEKCDGSGYLGLDCGEIPIEAKILAVADVYDALVSDRPYRKGLSPFEAKEIIVKGAGKYFDPQVVAAFVKAFDRGEMDVPRIVV